MIRNYMKIAWRNLVKNKLFSLINVLGLSIGIAASLLIFEYVSFELSFDQFNKNAGNIYRIYNDRFQDGKLIQHSTITYSAVSKAMHAEFPEIIDYTRVLHGDKEIIISNGKKLGEQKELLVENSFLTIFSYRLLAGDPKTALSEPNTLVVTQSLAKKLFNAGDNDLASVLGKNIIIGNSSTLLKITGVCSDVPANSHLQFDLLRSYISVYAGGHSWKEADFGFTQPVFWHYIILKPGINYKDLEAKFAGFSQRHFDGNKVSGSVEKFYLQPLLRAHLYSDFEYEIGHTASATVVWGLFIIASLIMIIAWINYVNLATAKSMERAKEVGVRKVAGATKQQLVIQFMTESFIINLFSFVIAMVIIAFVQGRFNALVNQQLSLSDLFGKSLGGYSFSALLLVLILSGIFLSGFYPSFMLCSFKPVLVLKGKFINTLKGVILRKVLVVWQFTITIALIISAVVVYKQIRFVSEQNLGFNMSQILVINNPELIELDTTLLRKKNVFIAEIKKIPGVSGSAFSWSVPGDELGRHFEIRASDLPGSTHYSIQFDGISPDFISVYQMKMLAGRPFLNTDYTSRGVYLYKVILNSAAIKMLGFKSPENAIGRQVWLGEGEYDIVGIVSDFHQKSLHYPIEPTVFLPAEGYSGPFSVKIDPHHPSATINAIKQNYDTIFPGNLFNYYFLDQKFNQQYSSDQLFGKVFTIFSGLAIFIACLGLFGLSIFATLQRKKEIGIRKVLGASVGSIFMMLSTDFIGLVLLAILIASPIAFYIMHIWLQNFVSQIQISWWIFIGSASVAVIIAFLTISFQSVKAALANPVKSLRSE
ncbi:MAG TPA: ABC transporter permease [Puia sp.]|nr:ABC transporter permease [Puia sp.]